MAVEKTLLCGNAPKACQLSHLLPNPTPLDGKESGVLQAIVGGGEA